MFASNHHSLLGSTEDPKDGGKVAAAVFGAVGVYGVSPYLTLPYLGVWGGGCADIWVFCVV